MTDEEKQAEIEKHRILLFAILDYHLEYYTGSMVFDQWDPAADFYLQEKQRTEKDCQEFRIDILQQRLDRFVKRLRDRVDLNFGNYIKERTGYEIDIFADLRHEVATIASKGKIENDEELKSVDIMLQVYRGMSADKEQIDILVNLIDERKKPYEVISKTEFPEVKHVIVQVAIPPPDSNYPVMADTVGTSKELSEAEFAELQRKNGLLSEARSPDNRRQIMTRTNGSTQNALTEVSILLKGGSGCIYCAKGTSLPIKAYWKDNNTVVIETRKEYIVDIRHEKVRSFEDVVKIEYIES
ncbi:hypothetical protein FW774_07580 [Pedobacter sp. BS3]|uniref:hypothetical protein n=1 Tax=Pedobacter sp. BS3 TaxID=2567937 RepID=UPI0011EC1173|nr:hypothetical protein [Pedobacter sp. BS3]TZF84830.1 hypothetical protein FW774_07580 [Pedobacter sp. BS3]